MLYAFSKPALKVGSRDPDVFELQQLLSQKVRPLPITGIFDYETEIVVKYFQSRMFLHPDGVVDPLTWQALYNDTPRVQVLAKGSNGAAVAALQELLSIDFYYVGEIDGEFGDETLLAVQRFQADYALPMNGVVDARTWRALNEI